MHIRRLVQCGLLGAILAIAQVSIAFLPNIEIVSILLLVLTLYMGRYVIAPLYVFVLIEGLLYGFHLWWVSYLYVWLALCLLTHLCRRQQSALFWALLNGVFGLGFGALCAIPYLFTGGISLAAAYWIAGLYFDLAHCLGNFFTALLLFKPLSALAARYLGDWGIRA